VQLADRLLAESARRILGVKNKTNSKCREAISMKKHEESRRAFLIGTAVGASAVAGAGLVPTALAQTHEQHPAADAPATTAQGHAHAGGHGAFLNDDDAVTVTAFAERIMPGAPGKPGARDAGVINYIDLALAGAYSDLQDFYRRGLAALDAHCRTTYNKPFAQLSAAQQDEAITALEGGKATGFTWPTSQAFFETMRTHTMEGMFADPVYGGNKDFAGWVLVGFPGAQPLFSPADMNSKDAFAGAPIIGLQSQSKTVPRRS
jgi:gluconate 2-dehydrogenase gamma chain